MSQYEASANNSILHDPANWQRVANLKGAARQIREAHDTCKRHLGDAMKHAVRAGELLLQVRSSLPHGQWLPWLKENVQFSDRSARGYIRLFENRQLIEEEQALAGSEISVRGALQLLSDPEPVKPARDTPEKLQQLAKFIQRDVAVPDGLEAQPFIHFDEFTSLGHDPKNVDLIVNLMRPWIEKDYLPVIEYHEELGFVWHSMFTPDGLMSAKRIAIVFANGETKDQAPNNLLQAQISVTHAALLAEREKDGDDGQASRLDPFFVAAITLERIRDQKMWERTSESWDSFCDKIYGMEPSCIDSSIQQAKDMLAVIAA